MRMQWFFGMVMLLLLQPPSSTCYPQNSKQGTLTSSSTSPVTRSEIDSLRAQVRLLQDKQMQEYISTLEKTNRQLSLWFNPYAILIGSLAVLFALLAIVASVIIYRQGKDYKERLDAFVTGYQGIFDKLIKEWQSKRDEIDKQIQTYQAKLASATDEQKTNIEEEIEKLKAEKDSVSSEITSAVASMPSSGALASLLGLPTNKFHKCSQCGRGFMVTVPHQPLKGVSFGSATVTCPKCGNVDEIRV